jgi:hypothetical protein
MVKTKATDLWANFELKEENGKRFGICKECKNKLACNKGSTSSLRYHLQSIHPTKAAALLKLESSKKRKREEDMEELDKAIDDEIDSSEVGDSTHDRPRSSKRRKLFATPVSKVQKIQQRPVTEYFQKYARSDPRQLIVDMEITKLIVGLSLPFGTVDQDSFKNFVYHFDRKAVVKSSDTIRKYKLPLLYKNVKNSLNDQLEKDLVNVDQVALTSDGWTSRANDPFQSMTIHYVDDDFVLKRFCIDCHCFEGRHTANTIAKLLDEIVSNIVGLKEDTMKVCVHDAAANMIAGVARSKINDSFVCIDHILNTILKATIHECQLAKQAIERATELSSRCHRSTLTEQIIKKECKRVGVNYVKVMTPVKTRWNSNALMIESILRLKPALESLRDQEEVIKDLSESIPSAEEFEALELLLPLLNQVKEVSEELSKDNYPTCHVAFSLLFTLEWNIQRHNLKHPNELVSEFCKKFQENWEKRLGLHCGSDIAILRVGHLLHPHYRGALLKKLNLYNPTIAELVENHPTTQTFRENSVHTDTLDENSSEEFDVIDQVMQEMLDHNKLEEAKPQLEQEFEKFQTMERKTTDKTIDPLLWWKNRQSELPLLSRLARSYLCIPMSSSSSERLFSAAGNIVTPTRYNLEPETITALSFCQQNMSRVKVHKWEYVSEDDKESIKNMSVSPKVFEVCH